nr:hypothetical protein [Actinacidiphila yeochonensis]
MNGASAPNSPNGPDGPDSPGPRHDTTVTERGAFASARCSCGWRGPARRARDRARRDAHEHAPD